MKLIPLLMLLAQSSTSPAADQNCDPCTKQLTATERDVLLDTMKLVEKAVTPQWPNPESLAVRKAIRKSAEGARSTLGCVTLGFNIGPKGEAYDIVVLYADPEGVFDEASIEALRGYRFLSSGAEQILIFKFVLE